MIALLLVLSAMAAENLKTKPLEYWKAKLSKEEVEVCREGGTERAFTGKYDRFKEKGTFVCSSCGQELFSSAAKFNSGTGWPSFWQPIKSEQVVLTDDSSFGMKRVEVKCGRCGAHLGHVFDDGPEPTGKRYCINSVCLKFTPTTSSKTAPAPK